MAPRQAKRNIQKGWRQPSPEYQGKKLRGIKKEPPQLSSRRSARLEKMQGPQEPTVSKDRNIEIKHPLPSPTSNTPGKEAFKFPQNRSTPLQHNDRKRKRAQAAKEPPIRAPSKRPRTSIPHSGFRDTFDKLVAEDVVGDKINSIAYWIQNERWPKEYFD
ncbi:hypothetical protein BJ875DRAFT_548065 [Amylocarpus encephaloides]|uniref:Uncharacterized protein n=1 Tax=Amylocarpus encephaloides TaxID=45428 RepID=A0A9P8C0B2_9HELO|nr:hypothetical protein BJ875DRAFT_548065 [Amylocarpus encephaloides]